MLVVIITCNSSVWMEISGGTIVFLMAYEIKIHVGLLSIK